MQYEKMSLPGFVVELRLGLVTQNGKPDPVSGYIDYDVEGVEGEILINGPLAAQIAEKICELWNKK